MPIEIRELIIKAKVDKSSSASNRSENTQASSELSMNEIAERVFEILKDKSER